MKGAKNKSFQKICVYAKDAICRKYGNKKKYNVQKQQIHKKRNKTAQ